MEGTDFSGKQPHLRIHVCPYTDLSVFFFQQYPMWFIHWQAVLSEIDFFRQSCSFISGVSRNNTMSLAQAKGPLD